MPNKKYFSYIRVSTQRQGQTGTSLTEQQAAIERYAASYGLPIIRRFEERETAAKQGRPVFLEMLKQLRRGIANGVIIHKIDRSARNLRDWTELGSLIDMGLDIHFASESLDLTSRGGRLSADIQAVVASDYIRNLREETRKGIYGRLKQGLYPFRAMIGYLDSGSGNRKEIDPLTAPLIRKAFEMYATGDWSLVALTAEMNRLGLRTKSGKVLTKNGLAYMLHNRFYIGVIDMKISGESYTGIHEPIVSRNVFEDVQAVLAGKNIKKTFRHDFNFRRMINCQDCGHVLTAEIQKGITYYRCRWGKCMRLCLNEDAVHKELKRVFKTLEFSPQEFSLVKRLAKREAAKFGTELRTNRESIKLRQANLKTRYSKLADAFMDGVFDRSTYLAKKDELVKEEVLLKETLADIDSLDESSTTELDEYFELANSAYLCLLSASPEQKRQLVKTVTSNIRSNGKSVSIKLKEPFQTISNRASVQLGCPYRDTLRTVSAWISQLFSELKKNSLISPAKDLSLRP